MPDVRYIVRGGSTLHGTAVVQGAKNAVLPAIATALLAPTGRTVLRNVPDIGDVRSAIELARHVGAAVEFRPDDGLLIVDASGVANPLLPAHFTTRFRGSVLFLPAVLHRCGEVIFEGAGGCKLGTRGLDFHYRGFARLGARVEEKGPMIHVKAGDMRGTDLYLDIPSHTGTENLLAAAALTPGRTVIENAAREPEILDIIDLLTTMGARITGGDTGRITIEGVEQLAAVDHAVMPDRIDAGVLCAATAITGGEVTLVAGPPLDHLGVARYKFEQMGVELTTSGAVTAVTRSGPLQPINIVTDPYPGFATDLQPPFMALATRAAGASYIRERIHDARYALATELTKLGADIGTDGEKAIVNGTASLRGAEVRASDLRTGISLVIAGLVAEGETVVTNGAMIDRGHARLVDRFTALGADIRREDTP